jgi:glycosyltransferase involved in cell wall biosynthesis
MVSKSYTERHDPIHDGSDAGARSPALSVLILTRNESRNLPRCLDSIVGWCSDIHVLDSFSTDDTADIARRYGARVYQRAFDGHTRQRAWALRNVPFKHEWVLALDADHRLTPALQNELAGLFETPPTGVDGYFINRRQVFRGRWLRFGGYYPKYMLKVFRRTAAFLDDDEFDYRFYVRGATRKVKYDLLEENLNEWDISFFVDKHVKFAKELAEEEFKRDQDHAAYLIPPRFFGTPDQRVLWLKTIWRRMPLYVRPFLLFGYRYVLRFGFLDGKAGFVFYTLQSFWFRLLVDIRLDELRQDRRST